MMVWRLIHCLFAAYSQFQNGWPPNGCQHKWISFIHISALSGMVKLHGFQDSNQENVRESERSQNVFTKQHKTTRECAPTPAMAWKRLGLWIDVTMAIYHCRFLLWNDVENIQVVLRFPGWRTTQDSKISIGKRTKHLHRYNHKQRDPGILRFFDLANEWVRNHIGWSRTQWNLPQCQKVGEDAKESVENNLE